MQDPQVPSSQPVQVVETGSDHDDPRTPATGVALSLSGGGYRAMLFHIGALWRLNELGYLKGLEAGFVGIGRVDHGGHARFQVGAARIRCERRRRELRDSKSSRRSGRSRARRSTARRSSAACSRLDRSRIRSPTAYREHLFDDATLQDLPDDAAGPRFVINATSVQTGALFRFSRPYIADYRVGRILESDGRTRRRGRRIVRLSAGAVAVHDRLRSRGVDRSPAPKICIVTPYTVACRVERRRRLRQPRPRDDVEALRDDSGQQRRRQDGGRRGAALRLGAPRDSHQRDHRQPGPQPARASGDRFVQGRHPQGTYWGIRTDIAAYGVGGALPCPLGADDGARPRPDSPEGTA